MGDLRLRDCACVGGLLATAAGLAASAFAQRPSENQPVRIGYLPILDAAPLLVAHARKLFEAEGLRAEEPRLFRAWPQIVEAFLAQQVNVIHILMPTAVLVRYSNRYPAKVVAWNHTNGSAITVQPQIREPKQLAGQTVAVPFWFSIHNVILQAILRETGLKPVLRPAGQKVADDEVGLTVMPPPDMVSALANRSIAGYIVAEPFNAAAENLRVGRLLRLTGDVWRDHACCVVLMHQRDVDQNPQWVQRVVNAIVKAQVWIRANRPGAAKLLSREGGTYTPHPEAVVNRVLTAYDPVFYRREGAIKHPNWKVSRIDFQPYPFKGYTRLLVQLLQRTAVEGDRAFLSRLTPDSVANDLVDERFVRRAIAAVGGPRTFGLPSNLNRQEVFKV